MCALRRHETFQLPTGTGADTRKPLRYPCMLLACWGHFTALGSSPSPRNYKCLEHVPPRCCLLGVTQITGKNITASKSVAFKEVADTGAACFHVLPSARALLHSIA